MGGKLMTATVAAFALTAGGALTARADAISYPHRGTPNTITYSFTAAATADIKAYFAGSGASYDEQ